MTEAVFYALLVILKLSGLFGFMLFGLVYNVLVVPFPYDVFVAAAPGLYGVSGILAWCVAVFVTTVAGALCYVGGQKYLAHRVEPHFEGRYHKPKLLRRLRRWGPWAVLATVVMPAPFSAVCWAAGSLSLPRVPFFLALVASRMLRYGLLLGYMGLF